MKHNWHLSVQSSLLTSMNTRKSKDCCEADTLTFSLKATNCNQIHHAAVSEITLVQVSLVSPNWKLHKNVIISSGEYNFRFYTKIILIIIIFYRC